MPARGVGVLSRVSVQALGHVNIPPDLLFRGFPAQPGVPALSPLDYDRFKRDGARNKLRVGNFLTFSGSPGIWGPSATNSALLAIAEINARGGILGRELELTLYDSGGDIEEVAQRARDAVEFDEVDIIMGSHI